jgi:DNA-binding CsgD family transcriptional regulator
MPSRVPPDRCVTAAPSAIPRTCDASANADLRAAHRTNVLHPAAAAALLASVAALLALDLGLDLRAGTSVPHALIEGAAIALSVAGVVAIVRQLRRVTHEAHGLREQARALTTRLDASRRDAERWRREAASYIAGLGAAIDQQLDGWGLTGAEKEIALLLLKGLEHKQIAELRGVGETTVRQQAAAVYRKAGLGGRHDLAAFFLEDLLGPQPRPPA